MSPTQGVLASMPRLPVPADFQWLSSCAMRAHLLSTILDYTPKIECDGGFIPEPGVCPRSHSNLAIVCHTQRTPTSSGACSLQMKAAWAGAVTKKTIKSQSHIRPSLVWQRDGEFESTEEQQIPQIQSLHQSC